MIGPLSLNVPNCIEFGSGRLTTLIGHLQSHRRIFILVDAPILPKIAPLIAELTESGKEVLVSTEVVPEPPLEALEVLLAPVRTFAPDAVVGVGGGSAMDLAKLVAVLFEGLQKTQDIIGIGKVTGRKVFLVTVSTTAGTGSEVTPIAVLTDTQAKLKKGVVSRYLIPDVAIVDPDLTLSLPAAVTAATGMDAMTHCIEAYTNRFAHPIIDNLAMDGIRLIAANLETCVKNGSDLAARTSMALGSLYGGLCLGPVNTAAVHAMAYPLGGTYKISHGVSNSVLLPFVMAFNLSGNLSKYAAIALAVGAPKGSDDRETAFNGVLRVRELSNACGIPQSLKDLNIPESAIPEMAKAAILVTRLMDNNPRKVELKDAEEIYRKAYHGQIDRD
jgi:alcohol dehydrogenase class IV